MASDKLNDYRNRFPRGKSGVQVTVGGRVLPVEQVQQAVNDAWSRITQLGYDVTQLDEGQMRRILRRGY